MFRSRVVGTAAEAATLKNLKVVNFDYSALDDKGLAALKTLPNLRQLSPDNANGPATPASTA